jgi:3-methyladenine DNA glycosylase AlkC
VDPAFGATFAARKGAIRPRLVPPGVLDALHHGSIQTANLMEQIALNMPLHLALMFPTLADRAGTLRSPRLLERMRAGGSVLLEEFGPRIFHEAEQWPSDTSRGWAAMAVGLAEGLGLQDRLGLARRFADDSHFAVREWSWLGVRDHICEDPVSALTILQPWTNDSSSAVRRFASEATRPIGVWSRHVPLLKRSPELALPLLEALVPDNSRYVMDSIGNWMNDASRSRPAWVHGVCASWHECYGDQVGRVCKRALRTIVRQQSAELSASTRS